MFSSNNFYRHTYILTHTAGDHYSDQTERVQHLSRFSVFSTSPYEPQEGNQYFDFNRIDEFYQFLKRAELEPLPDRCPS